MNKEEALALKKGDVIVASEALIKEHGEQWAGEFIVHSVGNRYIKAHRKWCEYGEYSGNGTTYGDFLHRWVDVKPKPAWWWKQCGEGNMPVAGEQVKLIDSAGFRCTPLTIGKLYEVKNITPSGFVAIEDDDGASRRLMPRRFERLVSGKAVVEAPKLKEGDEVVVCQKVDNNKCKWLEEMDECINEKGTILSVTKEGFCEVETTSGTFFYPVDALLTPKEFKRKGGKLKVNNAIIEAEMRKQAASWLAKNNHDTCVSRFARFYLQDGEVEIEGHDHGPCHAGLGYRCPGLPVGVFDVPYMTKEDYRVEDIEAYKQYVDYIVNRSPFNVAYQKGQTPEVIMKEGVWMDVAQSSDILASACIALRHGTEHPDQIPSFAWFVKQGFDEGVAWLASWIARVNGDKVTAGNVGGGHMLLASYMSLDDVVKFFKHGKFVNQEGKKPYNTGDFNYRVFQCMSKQAKARHYYDEPKVKKGTDIRTFVDNNFKPIVTGKGFSAKGTYTLESALTLANALKKEFENA